MEQEIASLRQKIAGNNDRLELVARARTLYENGGVCQSKTSVVGGFTETPPKVLEENMRGLGVPHKKVVAKKDDAHDRHHLPALPHNQQTSYPDYAGPHTVLSASVIPRLSPFNGYRYEQRLTTPRNPHHQQISNHGRQAETGQFSEQALHEAVEWWIRICRHGMVRRAKAPHEVWQHCDQSRLLRNRKTTKKSDVVDGHLIDSDERLERGTAFINEHLESIESATGTGVTRLETNNEIVDYGASEPNERE